MSIDVSYSSVHGGVKIISFMCIRVKYKKKLHPDGDMEVTIPSGKISGIVDK